ncbi:MAG: ATP-binding protein [Bermanella sp.]
MDISQYGDELKQEQVKRHAAEKMLDEKTREVDSSIAMMQYQFDNLIEQKKESDYLLSVARLAQGEESLSHMVKIFLKESCEYMGAKLARYSFIQDKKVVARNMPGQAEDIPHLGSDLYKNIYAKQDRFVLAVKDLPGEKIAAALQAINIHSVAFLPIKQFSKVATICEFYFNIDSEVNQEKLNQCQVAGYQIGAILERSANKKKIEESYQEIKSSHEKLKQAQSQLVQSEKMASLGQLAAGVAHEINNPIGFVMSNVDTLKEYAQSLQEYFELSQQYILEPHETIEKQIINLDEKQDFKFILTDIHELIGESVGGLKRVKDIVANLKSFARADEEQTDLFQVNDCIEKIVKVVWNELKYHVTLHKQLEEQLPEINGHEGQIGQVIMNILVNAAQSMEAEGDIHIQTHKRDEHIVIDIKDTGKGMSQSVQDKIFDPFFTTKGVSEGTGLGLSISYGIIDSHGGTIGVESVEGQGTCFSIALPAA